MVSVSVFQCTCTCLQYLPEQQCSKEEGPTLHSLEVKLYLSHGLQPGPLSEARQQRPNAGPFNPYPCLFASLNPAWSNSTPRHNCFNSSTTINHTPSTQRPQKIAYPKSKSFLAVSLVYNSSILSAIAICSNGKPKILPKISIATYTISKLQNTQDVQHSILFENSFVRIHKFLSLHCHYFLYIFSTAYWLRIFLSAYNILFYHR